MNWYWYIRRDSSLPHSLVCSEGDVGVLEDFELTSCKQVENWPINAWTGAGTAEDDGEPDDVLQTRFGFPIYSPRLCKALTDEGFEGIQFLPIQVVRHGGVTVPGFGAVNVLNCVDALDLDRSDFSRFPADHFIDDRRGKIRSVNRAVLRLSALRSYDVVRLSTFLPFLYVSQRFVDLFEQGRFIGPSFVEVETS